MKLVKDGLWMLNIRRKINQISKELYCCLLIPSGLWIRIILVASVLLDGDMVLKQLQPYWASSRLSIDLAWSTPWPNKFAWHSTPFVLYHSSSLIISASCFIIRKDHNPELEKCCTTKRCIMRTSFVLFLLLFTTAASYIWMKNLQLKNECCYLLRALHQNSFA